MIKQMIDCSMKVHAFKHISLEAFLFWLGFFTILKSRTRKKDIAVNTNECMFY